MNKEIREILEDVSELLDDYQDVNWEGTGPNAAMCLKTRVDEFLAQRERVIVDDDEPRDPDEGGICSECERGLPSWQSDGLCDRCAEAERRGE